jgi:hypothetical protein
MMEMLLSTCPNIEIIESIITAAAGNDHSGKEVMEMLLTTHPDIEITEPTVIAAAGNDCSGKKVMEMLLSTHPDIEITGPTVITAAGNNYCGKEVVEMLLDSNRQCEVHSGSVKAVAYFGMLDYTKSLFTKCSKITVNEKYTQLVHAAVESGVADILKLFLEFGGKHSNLDEHNWTAYMTASQSRNAFALQQFLDTVHPSFSSVFPPAK